MSIDAPALVLLPGMHGTGALFQPFVSELDGFDVRICGYPADEPLGYAELEKIVRRMLPTEGSFAVLGESFSGPIAVSLAASPPPGLVGVVLSCTFVRNPRPELAAFGGLIDILPVDRAPAALLDFLLLGAFSTPTLRAALAAAIHKVSRRTLRARLKAVLSVDMSEALAASKVPVLYLHATRDRIVPARALDDVRHALATVEVASIDGPHLLLQTRPEEAAAAVREFCLGSETHATP